MELEGRTAVVVGGASGMARATAELFKERGGTGFNGLIHIHLSGFHGKIFTNPHINLIFNGQEVLGGNR